MSSIWTMGEMLVEIMRPEADMPLAEPGLFRGPFPSGAPAIFIDTVARLGHSAGLIGSVGRDGFGECLMNRMRRDGVDTRLVLECDRSTAVAFVSYTSEGDRSFIFHFDGSAAVEARFTGVELNEPPAFFHIMGCSLMANPSFRGEIVAAMKHFAGRGARVSFDPNIRPELLKDQSLEDVIGPVMEHASILLPGVPELELLSGERDVTAGAGGLLERGIEVVVVKRGKRGASVYSGEGEVSVPAHPVEEVDPTGAGDAFDAGFLCGLLSGYSYEEAARVAARAGAVNAAAFGPMEGEITPAVMSL